MHPPDDGFYQERVGDSGVVFKNAAQRYFYQKACENGQDGDEDI